MKLVWSQQARTDVQDIFHYIAERNLEAASRLRNAIVACAERIPEHPFMYRSGRSPGTREAVIHPNYVLVYRVGNDAVEVVSVLHCRQQYPPADAPHPS